MHAVKKLFDREGVTTPHTPNKGKRPEQRRYWNKTFIRQRILDDVYRPHTFAELEALGVASGVLSRLDPDECYGVWWYTGTDGAGRRHRVPVPVPDASIPREWIETARALIADNRPPSSARLRDWELSRGVFRCEGYGRAMITNTANAERGHHYYRCPTRQHDGKDDCPVGKNYRADEVEPDVWCRMFAMLSDPAEGLSALDRRIETERERLRSDPLGDERILGDRLEVLHRRRTGYLELAADGYMTRAELDEKLAEHDETREVLKRELAASRNRGERLRQLERIRDDWARGTSMLFTHVEAYDPRRATPEERHRIYRKLGVKVFARPDGSVRFVCLPQTSC